MLFQVVSVEGQVEIQQELLDLIEELCWNYLG